MTAALQFIGSPTRQVIAEHVRVFNEPDGKAVAIDRRAIGIVKQGEQGETVVSFKLSGQRPIPLKAAFSDVYMWWVAPPAAEVAHVQEQ